MDNTWTKVRKNGVEDQILTDVINKMGKEKFEKLGWEILPSTPPEVDALVLKQLKSKEPKIEETPAEVEVLDTLKKEPKIKKVK